MYWTYTIFIVAIIYTLLPAYLANMAPVFAMRLNWLPELNKPIDGGFKIYDKEILGQGKTWRGLIVGIIVAIIISSLQAALQAVGWLDSVRLLDYLSINFLAFGFLAGLGALGGDIVKSFIKRRVNIASGNAWPIFDQLDFVLGFFFLTWSLVAWTENIFWTAIILTLAGHPLSNMLGYYLKIKKVWW